MRAAVAALPPRIELAEAINALDRRNAERFAVLRLWLIGGLFSQALVLSLIIQA